LNLLDWYHKFQNTGHVLTTYEGNEKSVRTPEVHVLSNKTQNKKEIGENRF